MATISRSNLGKLHEKISVKLEKSDYLPSFEKSLKEYGRKANIPGFRKGMVPAKKVGDQLTLTLKEAFEEKEREWIISDLGLDKNDPAAADKYFNIVLTKVGILEKRELNEEFFEQLYPGKEVKTTEAFRGKIKEEIQAYWDGQATNQLHDQLYHELLDNTKMEFPEAFLKNWLKTQGENPKTDEDVEADYPKFNTQLKWTLISEKIVNENNIQVDPQDLRSFAKNQLFSYMGGANLADDQPWVNDYVSPVCQSPGDCYDAQYH
ncbi:MAG: hypothetical protein EBR19_03800 [Chitinophagaceae bacterium]|nr:hypothetical protein [Chitinophagaceae bacterium]